MATATKAFDTAEYLENAVDIAAYMTEALATGDAAVIARPEFTTVLRIIDAIGLRLTAQPTKAA